MDREPNLTLLEALLAWPSAHRARLAAAGATAAAQRGPADGRPKQAAWLDVETPTNLGELIVWDSGEAELTTAQRDPDGAPGVTEHLQLDDAAQLERALERLLMAMGIGVPRARLQHAAVAFVVDYERRHGREPRVTADGRGADIVSPPRWIEVKAIAQNAGDGFLTIVLSDAARARARSESGFFLYLVHNVAQGDPKRFQLRVVTSAELRGVAEAPRAQNELRVPAQPLATA